MSLGTPTAIATNTVFGYVFDDDGVTPIEGAVIKFRSDPYMLDDNLIEIDEEVTSDVTGLYQVTLPITEDVAVIIEVKITWESPEGRRNTRNESIIIPSSPSPVSVQVARASVTGDVIITGGAQGLKGEKGDTGAAGPSGDAEAVFNLSTSTSVSAPGMYFIDATSGNITITIPDPAVGTQSNKYRVYKDDSSTNTVTVVTTGGEEIGDAVSQLILFEMEGFSVIDNTSHYELFQDSRSKQSSIDRNLGFASYYSATTTTLALNATDAIITINATDYEDSDYTTLSANVVTIVTAGRYDMEYFFNITGSSSTTYRNIIANLQVDTGGGFVNIARMGGLGNTRSGRPVQVGKRSTVSLSVGDDVRLVVQVNTQATNTDVTAPTLLLTLKGA